MEFACSDIALDALIRKATEYGVEVITRSKRQEGFTVISHHFRIPGRGEIVIVQRLRANPPIRFSI